jgi:hypothetical protein
MPRWRSRRQAKFYERRHTLKLNVKKILGGHESLTVLLRLTAVFQNSTWARNEGTVTGPRSRL